jgi:hypothetical protein
MRSTVCQQYAPAVIRRQLLAFGTAFAIFPSMNRFFSRNLDFRGRMARGVIGALCLIAGIVVVDYLLWLGLVFVAAGLFAIFEAVRGWCIARACGIKTKF